MGQETENIKSRNQISKQSPREQKQNPKGQRHLRQNRKPSEIRGTHKLKCIMTVSVGKGTRTGGVMQDNTQWYDHKIKQETKISKMCLKDNANTYRCFQFNGGRSLTDKYTYITTDSSSCHSSNHATTYHRVSIKNSRGSGGRMVLLWQGDRCFDSGHYCQLDKVSKGQSGQDA